MSCYKLLFLKNAKKEWDKLDNSIKIQLHKKLKERLLNPKVPSAKLSGYDNIYKIKLRSSGFRLVYEVKDEKVVVLVLKIGKRDNVYELLEQFLR
jgi:mRNA interferase RelE/StbE